MNNARSAVVVPVTCAQCSHDQVVEVQFLTIATATREYRVIHEDRGTPDAPPPLNTPESQVDSQASIAADAAPLVEHEPSDASQALQADGQVSHSNASQASQADGQASQAAGSSQADGQALQATFAGPSQADGQVSQANGQASQAAGSQDEHVSQVGQSSSPAQPMVIVRDVPMRRLRSRIFLDATLDPSEETQVLMYRRAEREGGDVSPCAAQADGKRQRLEQATEPDTE